MSGADRTVRLWDIETSDSILTIGNADNDAAVAVSPDCQLVAAGSMDGSVCVWNVQGVVIGNIQQFFDHKDSVYSVAFSLNSEQLISGSLDKTMKIWELDLSRYNRINHGVRGGRCLKTFEGHRVRLYPLRGI